MSQEIEIEFKNILLKNEYDKLLQSFQVKESDAKKQTNYYFETNDFHLKHKGSALRIREKGGQYVFTLKQPHEDGLLETHHEITKEKFLACQENRIQLPNSIKKQLHELNVPLDQLQYKGALTTFRIEKEWMDCLIVFDWSLYHKKEDYELEVETDNYEKGKKIFKQIINEHNIIERETKNKIERFFEALS